jgi:hypothetical protein
MLGELYVTILIAKTTLYDEEWTVDTKSIFFGKLRRALQYLSTKGAKCSARIGKYLMFTYSTAVKKPDTEEGMSSEFYHFRSAECTNIFYVGQLIQSISKRFIEYLVIKRPCSKNMIVTYGLLRIIVVISSFFLYVNSSNTASTADCCRKFSWYAGCILFFRYYYTKLSHYCPISLNTLVPQRLFFAAQQRIAVT